MVVGMVNLCSTFHPTAIPMHASQLTEFLEGDMEPQARGNHLNTLKMNCYLLCQFVDIYEGEVTKPSTTTVTGGRVSGPFLLYLSAKLTPGLAVIALHLMELELQGPSF